jgi:hypothetical protein
LEIYGQDLVYAIGEKNEELIDYILGSRESCEIHGCIKITDKKDVPTGEYQCYSHYAYQRGLTKHAARLLEGEHFCYNERSDKEGEELNYDMAVSFFDEVMRNNNYKMGFNIMINYIGPRDRESYYAKFVRHATQIIYAKKENTTEIIEMFCKGLLEYYPVRNNPEAMEAISEMMIRDPQELKKKGQLLCNVLNGYVVETLRGTSVASVPGRVKAGPSIKPTTQEQ